jgi:hypothetical protein
MAIALFTSSSYRTNFINGWDRNVEHGGWSLHPPDPDGYWNPREGKWFEYYANRWRLINEGLPQIPDVEFFTKPSDVFDQITQQWSAMTPARQQSAVWDGRQHRWVLAELIDMNQAGSCRSVYEEKLRYLRQLHTNGQLDDELFRQQAGDLWKRYEHCV